jgi:flagellum-specific peptidoglycan hydrolase FlgJ
MSYSRFLYSRVKKFVDAYGVDIAKAIKGTGLFFSAVAAQKMLESDYGDSTLSKKHNNFGGIKNFGRLPNAGVVVLDTTERKSGRIVRVKQPFATFKTPYDAFLSYVKVLQDPTKRYTKMGVFTAQTPEEQIRRMVEAGYSTLKPDQYLKQMQGIIDATRDYSKLGKIN